MKRTEWNDQMEVFKQLTKFTYFQVLETVKEGQMRGIQTIDQVHVQSGDACGWDGMIRREVIKQLTKFTYFLETDEYDTRM